MYRRECVPDAASGAAWLFCHESASGPQLKTLSRIYIVDVEPLEVGVLTFRVPCNLESNDVR